MASRPGPQATPRFQLAAVEKISRTLWRKRALYSSLKNWGGGAKATPPPPPCPPIAYTHVVLVVN